MKEKYDCNRHLAQDMVVYHMSVVDPFIIVESHGTLCDKQTESIPWLIELYDSSLIIQHSIFLNVPVSHAKYANSYIDYHILDGYLFINFRFYRMTETNCVFYHFETKAITYFLEESITRMGKLSWMQFKGQWYVWGGSQTMLMLTNTIYNVKINDSNQTPQFEIEKRGNSWLKAAGHLKIMSFPDEIAVFWIAGLPKVDYSLCGGFYPDFETFHKIRDLRPKKDPFRMNDLLKIHGNLDPVCINSISTTVNGNVCLFVEDLSNYNFLIIDRHGLIAKVNLQLGSDGYLQGSNAWDVPSVLSPSNRICDYFMGPFVAAQGELGMRTFLGSVKHEEFIVLEDIKQKAVINDGLGYILTFRDNRYCIESIDVNFRTKISRTHLVDCEISFV